MKRRPRSSSTPRYSDRYSDDRYDDDRYNGNGNGTSSRYPEKPSRSSAGSIINSSTLAIIGAVLVLGIGLGAFFGYSANTSAGGSIDTRVEIDASVPNAELCAQYGAGAIAVDLRAFVTLSPFKVFISQPLMQPGCVLRTNNWNILQQRNVVDTQEARECKQRMNTFGFTGDIESGAEGNAKVDCVYANDAARNLFIRGGSGLGIGPDSERF